MDETQKQNPKEKSNLNISQEPNHPREKQNQELNLNTYQQSIWEVNKNINRKMNQKVNSKLNLNLQ